MPRQNTLDQDKCIKTKWFINQDCTTAKRQLLSHWYTTTCTLSISFDTWKYFTMNQSTFTALMFFITCWNNVCNFLNIIPLVHFLLIILSIHGNFSFSYKLKVDVGRPFIFSTIEWFQHASSTKNQIYEFSFKKKLIHFDRLVYCNFIVSLDCLIFSQITRTTTIVYSWLYFDQWISAELFFTVRTCIPMDNPLWNVYKITWWSHKHPCCVCGDPRD